MSKKIKCLCKTCGKEFYEYPSRIDDGRGIYCSKECCRKGQETYSILKCKECGKEFKAFKSEVNKNRKFCSRECARIYIHKHSNTTVYGRFFRIFLGMNNRCNTSNKSSSIKNYQNKGIKVLWNNFDEFKNDMYESYIEKCKEIGEKNVSIDRIDNNKSYYKENCRWASPIKQVRNRDKSINIIFKGKKINYYEFAKLINRSTTSVYKHLKSGKTPDEIYKLSLIYDNKGHLKV